MSKVFISYRRSDSQWQTKQLYEALSSQVADPQNDIFYDLDSMVVGADFSESIDRAIAECDVLIAVIGPKWLSETDPETGQRRLEDPKDFVRIEIASALRRDIRVVPILIDGTSMPKPGDLPHDIRRLSLRHGVTLNVSSFESDMNALLSGLNLQGDSAWLRKDPAAKQTSGRGFKEQVSSSKALAILATLMIALVLAYFGPSWLAPPTHVGNDATVENGGLGGEVQLDFTKGRSVEELEDELLVNGASPSLLRQTCLAYLYEPPSAFGEGARYCQLVGTSPGDKMLKAMSKYRTAQLNEQTSLVGKVSAFREAHEAFVDARYELKNYEGEIGSTVTVQVDTQASSYKLSELLVVGSWAAGACGILNGRYTKPDELTDHNSKFFETFQLQNCEE